MAKPGDTGSQQPTSFDPSNHPSNVVVPDPMTPPGDSATIGTQPVTPSTSSAAPQPLAIFAMQSVWPDSLFDGQVVSYDLSAYGVTPAFIQAFTQEMAELTAPQHLQWQDLVWRSSTAIAVEIGLDLRNLIDAQAVEVAARVWIVYLRDVHNIYPIEYAHQTWCLVHTYGTLMDISPLLPDGRSLREMSVAQPELEYLSRIIHNTPFAEVENLTPSVKRRNLNIHLIRVASWSVAGDEMSQRSTWQTTADLVTILTRSTELHTTPLKRFCLLGSCLRMYALPVEKLMDGDESSHFQDAGEVSQTLAYEGAMMIWKSTVLSDTEQLLADLTAHNHVTVYLDDLTLHELLRLLRIAHEKYGVELKDPKQLFWVLNSDLVCGSVPVRARDMRATS
ncbi:hypothetical protein LTR78_003460 [Recurvomyces mirabilis]|uniref:Uncharacterized protein n=1 Tax=Recurvomyces mirabilis TaxID=574656 RepID=A0AAE1C3L9_9PEZI|nr:hypothetical protein LTR78_003460 [Recurvomyces mirabilis]KAK5154506.1 hypothetical protein LTS14_006643 [Recurvomyces mirabilis]